FAQEQELFNPSNSSRAFIPSEATVIRGIILFGNGAGSDDRHHAEDSAAQAWARKHQFAIFATSGFGSISRGERGQDWRRMWSDIDQLVEDSGRPELRHAPWLLWGHSNGGQMAYGIARLMPEKTIAFIVNKGGNYPRHGGREPLEVPALFITGSRDRERRFEAISEIYNQGRAQGALWAWIQEYGVGHGVGSSQRTAFTFFEEVLALRYPHDPENVPTADTPAILRPLDPNHGWLIDIGEEAWSSGFTHITAASAGDVAARGWAPNESVARMLRAQVSYHPDHARSFYGKAIEVMAPYHPSPGRGSNFSPDHMLYMEGLPINYQLKIHLDDWQALEVFDGTDLIARIENAGSNELSESIILNGQRKSNMLYSEVILADGSRRTSHVLWLVSQTAAPPVIAQHPQDATTPEGSAALFAVSVEGSGQTSYEWYHDGQLLPQADGPILRLPAISEADAGAYKVRVSNPAGAVESNVASLQIGQGKALWARINFQPRGTDAPSGWMVAGSESWREQDFGMTYGWLGEAGSSRRRGDGGSPSLVHDTLTHSNGEAWAIALPNGRYQVRIMAGDPAFPDTHNHIFANNIEVIKGSLSEEQPWIEGETVVPVSDGRLVLQPGPEGSRYKICSIEIYRIAD
ncbi:MAG: hypothetical protein EA402_02465, partial [Planctomycetota bacterium]